MKYILVTQTFQKQLKRFRKYLKEQDMVEDIKWFIRRGLTKGEAYLKQYTILTIHLQVVKLRICVYPADFRYLVGIINEKEYLPIFIDLKTGEYGENLSLEASKRTVRVIETAILGVIGDYLQPGEESPKYTVYQVTDG
jgi:hypothetical protein